MKKERLVRTEIQLKVRSVQTLLFKVLLQYGKSDLHYWNYDEEELDSMLAKFWFGARKDPDTDEETDTEDPKKMNLMYSTNTMKNFRYIINRILKTKGHLYDIMSKATLSFKWSQQAFIDSQKELKALGKAEIKSAPEITEDGNLLAFYVCFFHSFFWNVNL